MSNLKTLTAFAFAGFLAVPVFAQDAGSDTIFDDAPDAAVADFTSADLDQDGSLNADEFVTYAVMRADDGEEAFKDIVLGGEYSSAFSVHDKDASGGLDAVELALKDEEPSAVEIPASEEKEMASPEN